MRIDVKKFKEEEIYQFYISKFDLIQRAKFQKTLHHIDQADSQVIQNKKIEFDKIGIHNLKLFKAI